MSISEIVGTYILGMPLLAWGGVIALLLVCGTAVYGMALMKGKIRGGSIGFHVNLARITIVFAFVHGLAALAWIFGL